MAEIPLERLVRLGEVLAEAEHDLAAWRLAHMLDESDEVIDKLGYVFYDKLAAALGIDPDGDAALMIANLIIETGVPGLRARQILAGLRSVMSS